MASIHIESTVDVSADTAWRALRRVADADTLFAPVLTAAEVRGDIRTVHFQNGAVIREHVIDVDEARRRVAYSAVDAPGLSFHHASMQIVEDGPDRCRFAWTTDFLPAAAAAALQPLIEAGTEALKSNLERAGRTLTDLGARRASR
jgi:Polyketide cyclase / dehydrase and lipid transport